ncbi:hypothetical protein I4F81_005075 [Pyropia yezoensis]|uniref:Uncharacterized protein n=1 Tax=Pyropia yezoensis TaxID=2788 RepID=A0ACC3BX87_PYRYE|nr:hypothetical protein I4F81_005075 [Neopyropia yezoensis]
MISRSLQFAERDSTFLVEDCSLNSSAAWCALGVDYLASLSILDAKVLDAVAAHSPVTHKLGSARHLLQAGQQRSPSSLLMPHPQRDASLLIARDAELVGTLVALARLSTSRVAWYLASSPGMGKTHFVWDLTLAVADINNDRYAQAAEAANLPRWNEVVSTLKNSRVCVVTFNGLCAWSSTDTKFVDWGRHQPEAVLLPVYLRILWCLRCADGYDFGSFCGLIEEMLASKATTVDAIHLEALEALKERPTIIVVEELSKVPPLRAVYDRRSPAEGEFGVGEDRVEATQGRRSSSFKLLLIYRHELCTMTRSKSVSVLFTAACPGTMLRDARLPLNDTESASLDSDVSEVIQELPNARAAMASLLVTSISSSHRRGSPYFVLFAVKVGFLDLRQVADTFFLPVFSDSRVIRMSQQHQSTYKQPARLSADALAWLSGGHGRSAAVLRDRLDRATGDVWSSVVVPAAEDLSHSLTMNKLLNDLFSVPVVVLVAVHNCVLNAELPLASGINLHGVSFKSWDSLFASNVLTDAVVNSRGTYKDPCMPPLFLVALLRLWDERRDELMQEYSTVQEYKLVCDVLDALASVYHSSDSMGSADKVWEYVSLWSDVVLTRLRAASRRWCTTGSGLALPHKYRCVTLSQLYPSTRAFRACGPHPVLDNVRLYARLESVKVNDKEASNSIPAIVAQPWADLVSTVFKCKPEQAGFDYIKFLPLSHLSDDVGPPEDGDEEDAFKDGAKDELFAICTSCKYTGASKGYLNIEDDVRPSLRLLKGAFGDTWEQWKDRVVLVVATNLKTAKKTNKKLTPEESSRVIIIGRDDHLAVYGRALSGFVAQGPGMFGAKVERK